MPVLPKKKQAPENRTKDMAAVVQRRAWKKREVRVVALLCPTTSARGMGKWRQNTHRKAKLIQIVACDGYRQERIREEPCRHQACPEVLVRVFQSLLLFL